MKKLPASPLVTSARRTLEDYTAPAENPTFASLSKGLLRAPTTRRPLRKRVEKTFHMFEVPDPGDPSHNKWRISLGAWEQDPPPPPTWRQYLGQQGYRFETPEALVRVQSERDLSLAEPDHPLPDHTWWAAWEYSESPQAQAFQFLRNLELGCSLNGRGRKAGRIDFVEGGWHPGSNERWVELRDDPKWQRVRERIENRRVRNVP